MTTPKKKEYWLARLGHDYRMYGPSCRRFGGQALMAFCPRQWHSIVAGMGSSIRIRPGRKIKISITPTKSGFSVRAIGKPEKI